MNAIQITPHFNLVEFACKDGTEVPQEYFENVQRLCRELEIIRDELCCPLGIHSGYRTPSHNRRVGGAKNSMHLVAKAADIVTKKFTPFEVHQVIEQLIKEKKLYNGGVGLYKGFCHYDVGKARRWIG